MSTSNFQIQKTFGILSNQLLAWNKTFHPFCRFEYLKTPLPMVSQIWRLPVMERYWIYFCQPPSDSCPSGEPIYRQCSEHFRMSISLLCSIEMKAECLIVFLRYSISCLQERSHQLITLQIQGYFIHLNLEGSIRRTKNGWFLVIMTHNLWLIKYDSFVPFNPNNLGGVHVVSFKC